MRISEKKNVGIFGSIEGGEEFRYNTFYTRTDLRGIGVLIDQGRGKEPDQFIIWGVVDSYPRYRDLCSDTETVQFQVCVPGTSCGKLVTAERYFRVQHDIAETFTGKQSRELNGVPPFLDMIRPGQQVIIYGMQKTDHTIDAKEVVTTVSRMDSNPLTIIY